MPHRLDLLEHAATRVQAAAAAFGPFHEHCALNWLDRSLSAGGSNTADLRSMLSKYDALVAECVLSADGSVDPRCSAIGKALDALQFQLDARASNDPDGGGVNDAREWVEAVLLDPSPSPQVLKEQKGVLFSECSLGDEDNPSDCELLERAIEEYYDLVFSSGAA